MFREEETPRLQLKKFSDGLKSSDSQAQRNYHQLNIERVDNFIKQNPLDSNLVSDNRKRYRTSMFSGDQYVPKVPIGDIPAEFNKDVGPKSRFGDGDGSSWDCWINCNGKLSDAKKTFDNDGFPRIRPGPTNGFKKFYRGNSLAGTLNNMRSYSQRKMEKSNITSVKDILTSRELYTCKSGCSDSELRKSISLPSLFLQDKDTYFSSKGRDSFFEYYREILTRFDQGTEIDAEEKNVDVFKHTDNSRDSGDDEQLQEEELCEEVTRIANGLRHRCRVEPQTFTAASAEVE